MSVRKNLRLSGIDIKKFLQSFKMWSIYRANRRTFFQKSSASNHQFDVGIDYPCLWDRVDKGGVATGQYFFQDLLVARKIYERRPISHVDIGSRVDGFVAHVAVFMTIFVIDIRDLDRTDGNILFEKSDITVDDPDRWETIDSLSCLHALEHFGLGRYGDTIDYEGHVVGFKNMAKMLKPGGVFYFSVPIGFRQRIEYDAHRVFSVPYLLALIKENGLSVTDFHYVDDRGLLRCGVPLQTDEASRTFNLHNGCGIFELTKQPTT